MKTNESRHTPGPWKVVHPYVIRDELDGGPSGIVANVRQYSDGVMQWAVDSPASQENVANARLIATAPDMVTRIAALEADNRRLREALQRVLTNAECTCCDMPDGEKCNECKAKLVLEGKP